MVPVAMVKNGYVDGDVKVINHCHITGKYIGFWHEDCNIKVKLNNKIPVIFHDVKNNHSHLIMQELRKFDFQINFIPNRLEKYIIFKVNNKLIFIVCF